MSWGGIVVGLTVLIAGAAMLELFTKRRRGLTLIGNRAETNRRKPLGKG